MKKKLFGILALTLVVAICLGGCGKKVEPLSDTEKWFNTSYAVLIAANKGDMNQIGGYEKSNITKGMVLRALDESWGVTDRATADQTIADLLEEGLRFDFNEEMVSVKETGLLDLSEEELEAALVTSGVENANMLQNAIAAYHAYGENAIAAWDYCRALQLLGYYYVADLYTKQEAMDKSLEIATTLQALYDSWDDLVKSYLYGYQYWQEDDASDPASGTAVRTAVYEELKASENNPYTLDWNTALTKTW